MGDIQNLIAKELGGMIQSPKKLKLYGFNNLTKSLSFNIYDICYAKTPEDKKSILNILMNSITPPG